MKPKISVVIPMYNEEKTVAKALESLKKQSFKDFEVLLVDDGSKDRTAEIAEKYYDVVRIRNSGPAVARNIGIRKAKGEIIAFMDADCEATENWLEELNKGFKEADAVMGQVKIRKAGYIGDSISALGFPAGANIGFDKIWHVDKEGYTTRLSTCNCAIKKEVFEKHGMFDESFPYAGGEDGELPIRISRKGARIRYNKNAIVYHEPRTKLWGFFKWQLYRGKGYYYFLRKVGGLGGLGGFVKQRMWGTKNIIKESIKSKNIFLVVPLLISSFALQKIGYFIEAGKNFSIYGMMSKLKKPLGLQIETTTKCNLRCEMCEHSYSKGKGRDMSREEFDKIKGKYLAINLTGVGEGLLNKDFIEIIKKARKKATYLTFTDNFTLMKDYEEEIRNARVNSVFVSVDGSTKETFEKIRRGANFEKVMENIKSFSRKNKNLTIRFVPSKINIKELPGVVKLAKELGVRKVHVPKLYVSEETKELIPSKEEYDKYFNEAKRIARELKIKLRFAKEREPIRKCRALYSMYVTAGGEVLPCCFILQKGRYNEIIERYGMGNVFENGIRKIWNSEKYKSFRTNLELNYAPEMCRNCELYYDRLAMRK